MTIDSRNWACIDDLDAHHGVVVTAQAIAPRKERVLDPFTFTNHFCPFPIQVTTTLTGSDSLFFGPQDETISDVPMREGGSCVRLTKSRC